MGNGKKSSGSSRSFLRLVFWEALAFAGFFHIVHNSAVMNHGQALFFDNALFFLGAYPVLYIIRWKIGEGCLGTVLLPLGYVLSLAMAFSAAVWVLYLTALFPSPSTAAVDKHFALFVCFFMVVYYSVLQPFLGTGRTYYPLPALVRLVLYAGLGGFLGYLLGNFVDQKFGASMGTGSGRFILWLVLIVLGTVIGGLAGQKNGGK